MYNSLDKLDTQAWIASIGSLADDKPAVATLARASSLLVEALTNVVDTSELRDWRCVTARKAALRELDAVIFKVNQVRTMMQTRQW